MMVAIGLLDVEMRSMDRFTTDAADPVRPGSEAPSLIRTTRAHRHRDTDAQAKEKIRSEAEALRVRATRRVQANPTTTTWARLALAHLALSETDEAVTAARSCLDVVSRENTALKTDDNGAVEVFDVTSARIAAEVLLQHGEFAYAYEVLRPVIESTSLAVTFATYANEHGRPSEALALLDGRDGPLVDSFKGYLLAALGKHHQAISHLRKALREYPEDADAAMNLAVVLWSMGAKKKAIKNALRATRTAPGRKDLSLRYLELLIDFGDVDSATHEIRRLNQMEVVPDAHYLVVQARVQLAKGEKSKALTILDRALGKARAEHRTVLEGEIAANRETLRYDLGRIDRLTARGELTQLLGQFPDNDAVLLNYCYIAQRRSEAAELRRAFANLERAMPESRRAFVRHQLAVLEGDSAVAADAATDWFTADKEDPAAASAAILSLGIGMQRWEEAATLADFALAMLPSSLGVLNNAAYAFAMLGRATDAKRLLEPVVDRSFVLKATLGVAYLAGGDVEIGMRLYREAADLADKVDDTSRCLMTLYQALVVRQLDLDKKVDITLLRALALAPVPLPIDWQDLPDFLRLYNLCAQNNYPWPLEL